MPALWFEPPVAIMLLMPITSAREFSSGPPELPGLMAASVWMASSISAPCWGADGTHRADDAARHGAAEPKRIADGIHILADDQALGIAQRGGHQARSLDLDDRKIVGAVASNHRRLVRLLVVESDLDLARIGDHVVVGQDMAFFVDDETRALAFLRYRTVKEVDTPLRSR